MGETVIVVLALTITSRPSLTAEPRKQKELPTSFRSCLLPTLGSTREPRLWAFGPLVPKVMKGG